VKYRTVHDSTKKKAFVSQAMLSTPGAYSNAFLKSLIEHLPITIFVKDARDLRYVVFNKMAEELVGASEDELIGKTDYDFYDREQAEYFVAQDRYVLASNQAMEIPSEQIRTRDRGVRYLHTRKIPLAGADGNSAYLIGISIDVTEQKKNEDERIRLARNEVMMRAREISLRKTTLLAEASYVLSGMDYVAGLERMASLLVPEICDGCSLNLENEGMFRRLVLRHRDPEKNKIIQEMKDVPQSPVVRRVMQTGISELQTDLVKVDRETQASGPKQYEVLSAIGVTSYIVTPISARGKLLGTMSLCISDSSRRFDTETKLWCEELGRRIGMAIENALLYERAQKAIAIRDEFLGIASHELKTPVTSLELQTQIIRRQFDQGNGHVDTPVVKKFVDSIRDQVKRLTKLIEDMLDVSKIVHGKLPINSEPVNLPTLVHEVVQRFQAQLNDLKIDCHLETSAGPSGHWDRYRIEQVVTNLMTNAIRYGATKPIHISVSESDNHAILRIRDNGIGIPKENFERIFQRFERVGEKPKGLGLGLYISKQIVESHNGKILVTSEVNQGSTFTVLLPLVK